MVAAAYPNGKYANNNEGAEVTRTPRNGADTFC